MPIALKWANDEKNIILSQSSGVWTWDEFHQSIRDMIVMMRDVAHRVDVINMRTADARMPKGDAIGQIRKLISNMPENHGVTVNVTMSAFGRALAGVMVKLYKSLATKMFFAATVEEAQAIIARERAKVLALRV